MGSVKGILQHKDKINNKDNKKGLTDVCTIMSVSSRRTTDKM